MSKFDLPTQFEINRIEIDGIDVIGLFFSLSLYENIYSPTITGSIQLVDTDAANFIEKNDIEGIEEIEVEFTNYLKETLTFKGFLNGLTNRTIKGQKIMYNFDFHSETMRKNEEEFVNKRFNNVSPQEIAQEMTQKIGGREDRFVSQGRPLNFLGSRKRPTEVMKYVLTHGVTNTSSATDSGSSQSETSEGTTGFLWWQTLDGYRFSSVDDLLSGSVGEQHGPFTRQLQNHSVPLDESMSSLIDLDFKKMGDYQSKLRSGAFKNTFITMDIDKGLYKEITYDDDHNMSEKQKKAAPKKSTRYMWRAFSNERHEQSCTKANDDQWDQSKLFLSQNTVRQNTFNDQNGTLTLPPRLNIRAGDKVEIKVKKVKSEKEGGYDKKHSGHYVVNQVGHHFFSDGRSYTKLSTIRSTIQQDDATSDKT